MTIQIYPVRRVEPVRKITRARAEDVEVEDAVEAPILQLPSPGRVRRVHPRAPREGQAAYVAQVIGQDGQTRGLRAGPLAIDMAHSQYERTEFSGSSDRRARSGARARRVV